MKSIAIFKEKYYNRYFDVSDEEEGDKAFIKVLTERMQNATYLQEVLEPIKPKTTVEESYKAQDDEYTLMVEKKWERYKQDLHMYETQQKLFELARYAIRDKDGRKAFRVLTARKNWEYEDFEIEDIEEV